MASSPLSRSYGVHQGILEQVVHSLFYGESIMTKAHKAIDIVNPLTAHFLEVDVWIPRLKLGLEFQDSHHYVTSFYAHQPLEIFQQRDLIKLKAGRENRETLVLVPCWWDGSPESLAATIRFCRPDLLATHNIFAKPIPTNPSFPYFKDRNIPDVGELMIASHWEEGDIKHSIEESSWWIGEKYDGIRFCWNPRYHTMYSRNAFKLNVLPEISRLMLNVFLDGEIWFGRGLFGESQKLVFGWEHVNWALFKGVIFDDSDPRHQSTSFEARYTSLVDIRPNHPVLEIAPRIKCVSPEKLDELMYWIVREGGEGMILQKFSSPYIHGRNSSLVKFKEIRAEMEGLVVDVKSKSICLQLPNGTALRLERPEFDQQQILTKGNIVSFRYTTMRNGVPIEPFFLRTRADMSWEDVVRNYNPAYSPRIPTKILASKICPPPEFNPGGHSNVANRRKAFVEYAKKMKFDPLISANWYSHSYGVPLYKPLAMILRFYQGDHVTALLHLFPDIGLSAAKFVTPLKHWKIPQNRQTFFTQFAKSKGFDPLVPDNWYNFTKQDFYGIKGGPAVLRYYNNSVKQAVIQHFPGVQFDEKNFDGLFNSAANRRKVCMNFAKLKGFDPFIPQNWSTFRASDIFNAVKGGYGALMHYNFNLREAVQHLFPDTYKAAL